MDCLMRAPLCASSPVEHALVGGQALLRDHIPHQHHQVVVRQPQRPLPQSDHIFQEALLCRVGQVVLRLPAVVHRFEEREQAGLRPSLQRLDHLELLGRDGEWGRGPVIVATWRRSAIASAATAAAAAAGAAVVIRVQSVRCDESLRVPMGEQRH